MANLAPLSTPAGGLGVQGQKRGAERVWGEGRHRMGAVWGWGLGPEPLSSQAQAVSCPHLQGAAGAKRLLEGS